MASSLIICPGIHDPQLTREFLYRVLGKDIISFEPNLTISNSPGMAAKSVLREVTNSDIANVSYNWNQQLLIFPTQDYPAYSATDILDYLQGHVNFQKIPIIFISFSAGVAGAIGAAWGWQMLGGIVQAFIAFDGWGVPLYGNFPIYRLSHDYFTHWSSALLGKGQESFYADPEVAHLQLWQKPDVCQGWWVQGEGIDQEKRVYLTAAEFVIQVLQRYS